jgi:hypothetical protein
MFALGTPEPVTKTLIAAHGDRPAVKVTFNPQPSPLSLRAARRAVAAVLQRDPGAIEEAGDAFSRALLRFNILGWEGIGDQHDKPVEPTPDVDIRGDDGAIIRTETGTISAFIAEPRLFEAADREYVLPWTKLDAEKNGFAPLPAGTSAGAMPADDTVTTPAMPSGSDGATSAHTVSTKPKPKRAKRSGKLSPAQGRRSAPRSSPPPKAS